MTKYRICKIDINDEVLAYFILYADGIHTAEEVLEKQGWMFGRVEEDEDDQ